MKTAVLDHWGNLIKLFTDYLKAEKFQRRLQDKYSEHFLIIRNAKAEYRKSKRYDSKGNPL